MLYTSLYNKNMDNVLKSVLIEELERNRKKQELFAKELEKYPKGSLSVVVIHGDKYLYRKNRIKNKVVGQYVGPIKSEAANEAYEQRVKYLKIKQDLKDLKGEEKVLIKAIKGYDQI